MEAAIAGLLSPCGLGLPPEVETPTAPFSILTSLIRVLMSLSQVVEPTLNISVEVIQPTP